MLIKDLSARLQARMESGDVTGLLDAEVSRLVRDLAGTLTEDYRVETAADVLQAVSVLVAVHWARCGSFPKNRTRTICGPA